MRLEKTNTVHAHANVAEGSVVATVEVGLPPARVFEALTSAEICQWWVRPSVFDTREWTGDVRAGGRWRTGGTFRGQAYALEGTYLEVDAPRTLVHTWERVGVPGEPSTVSYAIEPIDGGTRVTLRHSGLMVPEVCSNTCIGWETSFERLAEVLAPETSVSRG
jgi:uncharacterized protein YndB with AHSA1/START domain